MVVALPANERPRESKAMMEVLQVHLELELELEERKAGRRFRVGETQ